MGQSHSSNKPHVESSSPDSDLGANISSIVKQSKQTKHQVAPTDSFIRNAVHQLHVTRCEEATHSSCTPTESSNSTDDDQRSIAVADERVALHSNVAPSPPRSHDRNPPSHRQGNTTSTETYQILPRIIGRGSDGEVRKCIHRDTSRTYAVKTIPRNGARQDARIRREVALLKRMRHPNIISLHDVYANDDYINIVTELCEGGDLFDKILEKKALHESCRGGGRRSATPCFRERDAARIIDSLLLAVSYMHSEDVVHRDIKPENVMFVEKFDDASPIKLVDFGLSARHPRQCEPLTKRVGTAHYMAPELIEGSYGRECDLWSVGVVAYVMLCGRRPFDGPTTDVVFDAVRRGLGAGDDMGMGSSRLWNGVSECAKDFVRCLLIADPSKRWTADMALVHPWLEMTRNTARQTRDARARIARSR